VGFHNSDVAGQPEATILAGVFNNAGSEGKIRLSALKQFGLIEGTAAAYKATQLARDIEASADEAEKQLLAQRAMLTSKVFQEIYNTYQGDQASKAKIRGRTQQLGVHPDVSDDCTKCFVSSSVTAGLAIPESDGVRLLAATDAAIAATEKAIGELPEVEEGTDETAPNLGDLVTGAAPKADSARRPSTDTANGATPRPRTAADVTVALSVDSSLDGDKLEKQLSLLRLYGLI
jgi:hypothetical protein